MSVSASVSVDEGVNEWNRQTDDPKLSRERAYVLTLLTLPLVKSEYGATNGAASAPGSNNLLLRPFDNSNKTSWPS